MLARNLIYQKLVHLVALIYYPNSSKNSKDFFEINIISNCFFLYNARFILIMNVRESRIEMNL